MLKIMFVDDEITVINGLTKGYDWENMGFKVVAVAMDGTQALERFYETFPDVVITDICMHNKDGLSFISELKSAYPQVEIIVLSGYPDFYYAQTSMDYGVFAYLLKPLKNSTLFSTLDKLKMKIAQSRNQTPEQFLFHLLQMTSPTQEDIDSLCKQYNITLPGCDYFVAAIQIDQQENAGNHVIYGKLCEYMSERLSRYYNVYYCQPQHHHIALLLFCENLQVHTAICNRLEQIKEAFSRQYPVTFTIGISSLFCAAPLVRDAYLQSLYAISQKALYGYGCSIYYEKNATQLDETALSASIFISIAELEDILTGLRTFNRVLTEKALSSYFEKLNQLRNINIAIVKNALSSLTLQIIHNVAPNSSQMKLIFGRIPFPILEMEQLDLLSDMQQYIRNMINRIFSCKEFSTIKNYSKVVQDAQIYIMTNYPLPISVGSIAEELHIDRYQLMRVFKSETGNTINNCITDYRIRVATDLLRKGTYKISEVSKNVGYPDANYFSKIFKKYTGYLPSEYIEHQEV